MRRVSYPGVWTQMLADWLDQEQLAAPHIRARLASWAPDEQVPIAQWVSVLDEAQRLRPEEPALGISIGKLVQPRHLGVLGYLAMASDTLGEALAVYQRYQRLILGTELADVSVRGLDVEIRWTPIEGSSIIADELAIAALITFLRRQLDNAPATRSISFTHLGSPERRAVCESYLGCTVSFGDTHSRLRFPMSYLGTHMPRRDAGLRALLDQQAEALLTALPDPNAFDGAVQQLLVKMLPDGEVSIEKMAKRLHQSSRTLQRRLADSGMTWQELVDNTREQLARQYLADPGLSIAEVALLLGYSQQSAFTRAFSRWTGRSPLAYRQSLRS